MAEPIRVLIADDHKLFRTGLRMVLELEDGIEVVAEAHDGQEAVAKVGETSPDVVLMDLRMPRMGGIDATRAVRATPVRTCIIVLTVSDEDDDLLETVRAGANAYLLKETSIEEVADAVRAVRPGQTLLSPEMAGELLAGIGAVRPGGDAAAGSPLASQELEVLQLAAEGLGTDDIASRLSIPESVVRGRVADILAKLQLGSRT